MRKNPGVTPTVQTGTSAFGNNNPGANMPANNLGTFPVNMGTTHKSVFAKPNTSITPTGGDTSKMQNKVDAGTGMKAKANMPAHNTPVSASHPSKVVGHTKHAPGTVPGYLRGK